MSGGRLFQTTGAQTLKERLAHTVLVRGSVPISTQEMYLSTSTKYFFKIVLISTSTFGKMYLCTYKY